MLDWPKANRPSADTFSIVARTGSGAGGGGGSSTGGWLAQPPSSSIDTRAKPAAAGARAVTLIGVPGGMEGARFTPPLDRPDPTIPCGVLRGAERSRLAAAVHHMAVTRNRRAASARQPIHQRQRPAGHPRHHERPFAAVQRHHSQRLVSGHAHHLAER